MKKKNREPMTEREFIAGWEKNNKMPEEKEQRKQWEIARALALGHWLVERELAERELEQKSEREASYDRVKRHINSHILEKQYGTYVLKETCFLPNLKAYDGPEPETENLFFELGDMTALALCAEFGMVGAFAEVMTDAMTKELPFEICDGIFKEMLTGHEEDYEKLNEEYQNKDPERMVDLVQSAMQEMVKGTLSPNWNYRRLIRFLGDQMNAVFYQMKDEKNERLRSFREKFKERDTGNVMQSFQALRRMTELTALGQQSVEILKNPLRENDYFTPQELKDFLIGSYVSNELKKCYERKDLTKEALRFGDVSIRTNKEGGKEVVYGDEKLYRDMTKSASYQKLSRMKIGEIRKMLKKEVEVEKRRHQEKAPVQKKDRVMGLKPQKYD